MVAFCLREWFRYGNLELINAMVESRSELNICLSISKRTFAGELALVKFDVVVVVEFWLREVPVKIIELTRSATAQFAVRHDRCRRGAPKRRRTGSDRAQLRRRRRHKIVIACSAPFEACGLTISSQPRLLLCSARSAGASRANLSRGLGSSGVGRRPHRIHPGGLTEHRAGTESE